MATSSGLLPLLAGAARRFLGPAPTLMGWGAEVVRVDASAAMTAAVDAERRDCGPGGCGPAPGWHGSDSGVIPGFRVGLSRTDIDDAMTEMLMRTIVERIVDDANRDRPSLTGEWAGELSDCIPWLAQRGWFEADVLAQAWSRKDGGAAVLCAVDDGRPWDQEVDLQAIRDVRGFGAVSKWECVPDGKPSTRFECAWYGTRWGRPEHYLVTPEASAGGGGIEVAGQTLRSGQRIHRSRLVPRPYCDKMDLRTARSRSNWRGWGPGAVESCLAAYELRREGGLHTSAILRGSHINVLSMQNVVHAQATPDKGQAIRNAISWVKQCLMDTLDSIPFMTIDKASTFEAVSHNLAGVSDVLKEQRRFLLDNLPEYVEVVLFGSSNGGLSGDGKEGEWRAYYGNVSAHRTGKVWTAGAFGGGLRQACLLAMACPQGPTGGQMDLTVKAEWPEMWTDSAKDQAATRKANAEARALDRATLGLTPRAILRYDTTLAADYPALDVDDGILPTVDPGGGALEEPAAGGAGGPAVTPATAVNAIAAGGATDPAGGTLDAQQQTLPAVSLPDPADIVTEAEAARAFRMTKPAFQKWIADKAVTVYPMPRGMRGGARYSLGEVMDAWTASAKARVDAMRRPPTP